MEIQQIDLGQVAFNPKGNWNAETTYKRLNVVYYKGRSYYAKLQNTNQPPSMDSDFWGLMVDGGDVTNNVDEEDVTSMTDEDGKSVIKFADRAYDPDRFSGKGYKILRKNMQTVALAVTTINVTKAPSADGEILVVINDIETHVALSASSHNTTALTAKAIADALATDHEDYDFTVSDSTIKLIRKYGGEVTASACNVASTGMTMTLADSTKAVRRNLLTPIMISKPNTIYEIRYDFDLNGGEIEAPENCVLKFEGGSLNNGGIRINKLIINSNYKHCFKDVVVKNPRTPECKILNQIKYANWFYYTNQSNYNKDIVDVFLNSDGTVELENRTYDFNAFIYNTQLHLFSNTTINGNNATFDCNYANQHTFLDVYYMTDVENIQVNAINITCKLLSDQTPPKDHGTAYYKSSGIQFFKLINVRNISFRNIKAENIGTFMKTEGGVGNVYFAKNISFTNCSITGDTPIMGYQLVNLYIDNCYLATTNSNSGIHALYVSHPTLNKNDEKDWIGFTVRNTTFESLNYRIDDDGKMYNNVLLDCNRYDAYILEITPVPFRMSNCKIINASYSTFGEMFDVSIDNCEFISTNNANDDKYLTNKFFYRGVINNTYIEDSGFDSPNLSIYNSILDYTNHPIVIFSNLNPSIGISIKNSKIKLSYSMFTNFTCDDVELTFENCDISLSQEYICTTKNNEKVSFINCNISCKNYLAYRSCSEYTSFVNCNITMENQANALLYPNISILNCYINNNFYNYNQKNLELSDNESNSLPPIRYKELINKQIYKQDIQQPLFWDGHHFVTIFGCEATHNNHKYRCSTKERQEGIGISQEGTLTYDMDTKELLVFNGNTWINVDGTVYANKKGTTQERPNPKMNSKTAGFEYYDSDLKKKILWNGSNWVNIDGTDLD